MKDYLLGVQKYGDSIVVSESSINMSLSDYICLCQVTLSDDYNDNLEYNVSIIDKGNTSAFQIGEWTLVSGSISKNWGRSRSYLKLKDKEGVETPFIEAYDADVGTKGSKIIPMSTYVKEMFTKAQEIVRHYPNAIIFNAINKINIFRRNFEVSSGFHSRKNSSKESDEKYIEYMKFASDNISKYLELFKQAYSFLEECEDERKNNLIKTITSDFILFIEKFKIDE